MISQDDILAMCGLSESEVAAIAEHEHVPETAAAALANFLLHRVGGEEQIRAMLVDDIRLALDESRIRHATELFMALRHFLRDHPGAAKGLPAY
jgi:hypothetical protein